MKKNSLTFKWILSVSPLIIAGLMYFLLPYFPEFTEYIVTRGIFRAFTFPLEFLISLLPFSLTEIVVILLVPAIIAVIIIFIVRFIKRGHPLKTAERGLRFCVTVLSMFLLMFMLTDGCNFSRIDTATLFQLPDRKYTAQELYIVTADLAQKASEAREAVPQDQNGVTCLSVSQDELLRFANNSYDNLKKDYHFLMTGATRVKPVLLSEYWSYTGTTGVYCPWIPEASVNVDVPVTGIAHTCAHEIAHTMGFAKENECNFLSFLACITSEQVDYEYSGYFNAFIYCSNALYKADKTLWAKAYNELSDGVRKDLKFRNDYWDGFRGRVMNSSQSVNDAFIKANGVESGTLSYNEMVELLLKFYEKQGFFSID